MELLQGFVSIMNPVTLALIVGGVFGGLVIGALPGLSAFTALAIMLPFTFGMEPVNGISFLMAVYVGGCSGGLISAILLGIPGTPASIATCFDGYPMAQKGEAKKALGTAVLFSFIGGIFGALWEMGAASGVGIVADLDKIPIRQETIELCEVFDINPYLLISSGCMLIGCENGNLLVERLQDAGIPAAVIGRATEGNDRVIRSGEETRFLEPAGSDELYKIYE